MDEVVKITEIASNLDSDDVILDQNQDKPNCFLPSDTNLNCDDKTIIPCELEHCDNAEIHIQTSLSPCQTLTIWIQI